ncbi:hypothetical protein LP421_14585 [Rhizobium sp. RCAM05350]|nr:hypothetical protein LP421_14585 [Rhizobium sp. RCAM05350]
MQDLSGGAISHHAGVATAHHAATIPADHDGCKAARACDQQPKTVHPLLCAACFAVVLVAHGIDRIELPAGTVRPALQKPMLATILKPRFPPPKTFLSFS